MWAILKVAVGNSRTVEPVRMTRREDGQLSGKLARPEVGDGQAPWLEVRAKTVDKGRTTEVEVDQLPLWRHLSPGASGERCLRADQGSNSLGRPVGLRGRSASNDPSSNRRINSCT